MISKVNRKRTRDEASAGAAGRAAQDSIPLVEKSYMIERHADGKKEKMLATIIHVEWRNEQNAEANEEKEKQSGSESPAAKVGTDGLRKKLMFYVHYEMLDRRNDEWVTRERIFEEVDSHGKAIIMPEISTAAGDTKTILTRSQRRIHEEFNHLKQGYDSMDATTARLEKEHEERTKVKNIPEVTIGNYTITAWYYSPFPVQFNNHPLFMCEYCLLYTSSKTKFREHYKSCKIRHPPGNEIYRKDNLSVFEIDGVQHKLYCQCLCLLSKLFMDHKTLYFDVDDFMFYVLCETDANGAHIVGYFSREAESNNNLACIMVFPPHQNKGYGKFLIQLSYEISTREGYIGTPEKPLSDLGKVSYRSYWWWVLLDVLKKHNFSCQPVSELSIASGIASDDIVSTLGTCKMIRQYKEGEFMLRTNRRLVDHCISNGYGKPPKLFLDRTALKWRPAMTRAEAAAAAINTKGTERRASITKGPRTPDLKDDNSPIGYFF